MKVENVSLELVDPDLDQPRQSYEPDEIERLASSMRDLASCSRQSCIESETASD
jgi:hypothetical protein